MHGYFGIVSKLLKIKFPYCDILCLMIFCHLMAVRANDNSSQVEVVLQKVEPNKHWSFLGKRLRGDNSYIATGQAGKPNVKAFTIFYAMYKIFIFY